MMNLVLFGVSGVTKSKPSQKVHDLCQIGDIFNTANYKEGGWIQQEVAVHLRIL
jgi:hypothetical protein